MTTRSRRRTIPLCLSLVVAAASLCAAPAAAAVTASDATGQLRVFGDGAANQISLRLSSNLLAIEVRDGAVLVGSFLRSNFTAISIDAGGGNDTVMIDESVDVFTDTEATQILGGDGNDVLTGGTGAERIEGGAGYDVITGGRGADILLGGADSDTFMWNANAPLLSSTDGADQIDGEEGIDLLDVTGNAFPETYSLTPSGNRVVLARGGVLVSSGTIEAVRLLLASGDDTFTVDDAVLTPVYVFGGLGNDTLDGGGDDTFTIAAGDDSDQINGGPGSDRLIVSGTGTADAVSLVPLGQSVQMVVNPGGVSHFVTSTERLIINLGAGNDTFLANAGLQTLTTLEISGGDGDDVITAGSGDDTLYGEGGNDTLNGGDGNDIVDAGSGADAINGGNGNDAIEGGTGNDTIHGDAGDDTISWNAGDGSDMIQGDSGLDTLSHGGDGTSEQVAVGRNLDHVIVNHGPLASPPLETQNLATVERIQLSMSLGDDLLSVLPDVGGVLQRLTVNTGTGNDIISTTATSCLLVLDGDAGEDRLQYDALGQNAMVSPGVIGTQAAGTRVTHGNVEIVNVVHSPSAMPVVNITTPTAAAATTSTSSFVTLAGTTTDDGQPVRVTWFNDRGNAGGEATGSSNWTAADIPLQQGTNVITVYVFDVWNNVNYDTITVTVDALTYSLAEGATGSFFDLDVLIANPTTTPAPVAVTFLRQAGAPVTQTLTLAPTSRTTIHVDDVPGLANEGGISTVVTSTNAVPLVVERTMFWDASYYGSHGGTAVDGPRTRWLFAEGSEGFFKTFVLLANTGASPSTVTLTFLREGSTPFARTVTVPANARVTVAANGIPELVDRSFSIVVDATTPIIAERAMYFGTARLFDGGHESTGVPEGATSWFLAEGATGPFFETFVLVGNPNPVAANVMFTFLTDSGVSVLRQKVVPANGRLTVDIEGESPALANAAVSTTITADQPVIAERAMYWPGPPSTWAEAHNSFGATALATRWGLAEGRVGMGRGFQTFILLANPNATAANVQVTFLRANGSTVVKTFTVNPTSRFNVAASIAAPELQDEEFGALIEVTNGIGIGVERAMYSDALGQTWAAGTNALATRVP